MSDNPNILVAIPPNYGELSKIAMNHAIKYAKLINGSIKVVMINNDNAWDAQRNHLTVELLKQLEESSESYADNSLKKFISEFKDAEIPLEAVLLTGDPIDEIISYADNHDIELAVLGTHGRAGISHMMLGSVTEKVVRKINCPVLCVKE